MSRLFDYVIEALNGPEEVDMVFEENQLVMATAQDLVSVTEATYEYLMAEKEYYYGEITMEGLGEGIANVISGAINGLKSLWERIRKFFATVRDIILGKKKDKSDSNSSSSSSSSSNSSTTSSKSTPSSNNSSIEQARKHLEEKRKKNEQERQKTLKDLETELESLKRKKEEADKRDKEKAEKLKKEIEEKNKEKTAIEKLAEKNKKEREQFKDPLGAYSTNNGSSGNVDNASKKQKENEKLSELDKRMKIKKEFTITPPNIFVDIGSISLRGGVTVFKKILEFKKEDGSELTLMELREQWTDDNIATSLFKTVFGSINITADNFTELCKEKYSKKEKISLSLYECDLHLRHLREKAINELNKIEKELNDVFDTMIKQYNELEADVQSKREPIYDRKADNNIQILSAKRTIVTKASSYVLRFISTWRSCVMNAINDLEAAKKELS